MSYLKKNFSKLTISMMIQELMSHAAGNNNFSNIRIRDRKFVD